MGAVKIAQSMRVGRKVRRHPVQNQPDAGFMAARYQPAKATGIAKTRGGCIQADGLVTPGAVKWVLADWQQLQMGKAHVLGIGHQRVGQFVPAQPAVAVLGDAAPRPEVDFVNADGGIQRVGRPALL
ncbi:hypothetical protein GALL_480950 [mine drainage metagenome]|uniref:Uncharacterized protein n=1 Tax=mine drainage metagenome TaxID=410659 RepID=A0A1J5Q343_9ZZZZ